MPPRADDVVRVETVAFTANGAQAAAAAQVEEAERIARRLEAYAVAIVGLDGTVTDCGQPGCPLEYHAAGPTAVRLAVSLAAARRTTDLALAVEVPVAQAHLAHRRFVDQLSEAAASVWCCRRTAHRMGRCLYDAAGPTSGLCGRVLAVSRHYELGALAG